MSLGVAPKQADLFRSTTGFCDERVAPDSIYAVLHRECFNLFSDELFADLFTDVGRRSVPPMIVAVVMVLQRIEGLSDREAVDRFCFHARWKYAAGGLDFDYRAATITTVFGLLVVTGMRSGEAVRLDRDDVDLEAGRLRVVATKFDKSRELALHPTTVEALRGYADQRDFRWPHSATIGFFVSCTGRRLSQSSLEHTFAELVRRTGLEPAAGSRARRPRLTDARHSFAVATLIRWHRTGQDVQALLPALSAQLGHVDPASTYWYLTAVPELLALASARVQAMREVTR